MLDILLTEILPDGEGKVETRTNCTDNADMTLASLNNADHTPYIGAESGQEFNPDWLPTSIDTSQLALDFLSKIGETAAPSAAPSAASIDTSSSVVVKACIVATTMAFFLARKLF
jgi:hypothetical protein